MNESIYRYGSEKFFKLFIESKKLYDLIWNGIIQPEYTYEHWYQNNKDILIFDNSITLHNRRIENGVSPDRVALRIQYDYEKLVGNYCPFTQEQFNIQRQQRMSLMTTATAGMVIQN